MTQPFGPTSLHALLGLPADVGVDRLRYVYEQAMAAATRRGDRTRAITLSRAYDALPASTRQRVFPRNKSRAVGAPARAAAPPTRPRGRRRDQHRRPPPTPSAFTISDRTIRLLIWLLGVPIAVFAGVAIAVHSRDARQAVSPPAYQPPHVVPAEPIPTARVIDRNRRMIPADAPTDADGYVEVVCQRVPGRSGYEIRLRRGQVAYCTNGAVPTVVG